MTRCRIINRGAKRQEEASSGDIHAKCKGHRQDVQEKHLTKPGRERDYNDHTKKKTKVKFERHQDSLERVILLCKKGPHGVGIHGEQRCILLPRRVESRTFENHELAKAGLKGQAKGQANGQPNGQLTCKSSYRMTPRLQISTAGPLYSLPWTISGAVNSGVPHSCRRLPENGVVMPASPKSAILTFEDSSIRMFSGFRSL